MATLKQLTIGILGIALFFFILWWFGEAFRANTILFALLWVATPVAACFLNRRSISSCFTLSGLRSVQVALMSVVIAISFSMFANYDAVRNRIGKRYVEGYTYWRAELEIDDNGREYYPGDNWTAKNRAGRWGLQLFGLIMFGAELGLPALTLRATRSAIHKREAECRYTADGNRIETHESEF